MGNTLFRDLSIYWSMFHVALIFVMLFRSRFNRKKSLILVGVGIGSLMILNGIGLVVLGHEQMGKLLLFTCSLPSLVYFWILSKDRNGKFPVSYTHLLGIADYFSYTVSGEEIASKKPAPDVYNKVLSLSGDVYKRQVYGIAVEERSFKEMSAILQRTESTLRKRYERAKIKLKNDMDLMAGR